MNSFKYKLINKNLKLKVTGDMNKGILSGIKRQGDPIPHLLILELTLL